MSVAPSENSGTQAAQYSGAAAAAGFSRAGGLVLLPARRRRSLAHSVGADRTAGAEDRLAAAAGLERDGKAVPGLSNATFPGAVTLVNVWASWCVPCHDEVPFLEQLSKDKRIQLVGINYKDSPDNARRFLNRYGNPFVATGADTNGRPSIDWGVYGVPETFLVGRDGRIAYKLVGPITAENLARVLKPEIEKALACRRADQSLLRPRCISPAADIAARRTGTSAAPRRTI